VHQSRCTQILLSNVTEHILASDELVISV